MFIDIRQLYYSYSSESFHWDFLNSFSIQLVVTFSATTKRNTSNALLLLISANINFHIVLAYKLFCLCYGT